MMNEENKVLKAVVSLQVCPRRNGASECCKACDFVGTPCCSDKLLTHCKEVLNEYFMQRNDTVTTNAPDYEDYVSDVLLEVGIPVSLIGYRYIRRAIILATNDHEYVNSVTKLTYPTIADEFKVTSARVERGIRHCIEVAWTRGDADVLMKYFGNTINFNKGKPTNTEFIATMAEHVKRHFRAGSSK